MGASTQEAVDILLAVSDVDRVIDLVSQAWRTERRGKGGQWSRTPGGGLMGNRAEARAQRRAQLKAARTPPVTHQDVVKTAAKMAAHAQQQSSMVAQEHAHQAMMSLNKQIQEADQLENATEKKKSKTKFIAMAASLVGGAAAGYVEAKLGAPDLAQLVTSVSPALAEAFFERQKQL